MKLVFVNAADEYLHQEAAQVVRLFYPADADISIEITHEAIKNNVHSKAKIINIEEGLMLPLPPGSDAIYTKRIINRACKLAVYRALKAHTGIHPPWGSLTGIRPVKLAYTMLEDFVGMFDVTPAKTNIVKTIINAQAGLRIDPLLAENELDIYVGIPFCPSRCVYCSFASVGLTKRTEALIEPYMSMLYKEIENNSAIYQNKKIRAVYVGGGTPTALPPEHLDKLLFFLKERFNSAIEWTVEAGRPDTVTAEVADILHKYQITRVSINPQTMHDHTLQAIGRNHTAQDITRAINILSNRFLVNMDIIAGLPGEDFPMFTETLSRVLEYDPANITVHTLAIKRASGLWCAGGANLMPDGETVGEMISHAYHTLIQKGYLPYYLYRQKYMAGNQENIGYCKPGTACLYNIDNMEETHSVMAFGVGAISKTLFPRENRIERQANPRDIATYLRR